MCGDGLSFTSTEAGAELAVTPRQQFLSTTHPFRPPPAAMPPLDRRRSEKEEPWHAIPLVVVVVWCRPHTLPPVKVL